MSFLTPDQLILLLPEILLAFMAVVVMLLPRRAHTLAWGLTTLALALDMAMCAALWGIDKLILGGGFALDSFAIFVKVLLLGLALLNIIGSYDFTRRIYRAQEYYALLLTAMLGLIVIPSATDFITLLVGFELASIATYTLPMIEQDNPRGKEAALKYYLTGAFSSALILYGLSLLYGFCGTMNIADCAEVLLVLGFQPVLVLSFILLLAGFGYKMALVPLHMWAADTYQGSSSPTTGFLSGVTQKGAFIVALLLMVIAFAAISPLPAVLVGLLCAVTMTVGNVMALRQKDVKRMIAYSSVAHAGNIPVGFVVGTAMGMAGSFIHIIAHGVMAIAAFFVLRIMEERKGGTSLEHFRGLGRQMPAVAAAMMLVLLSFGGVPPLLGFWGKMVMVVSALGLGGWYSVLALILVLNSALSLVYYASVIREMYMRQPEYELGEGGGFSYTAALWLAVALLVGLGLLPNQLTEICLAAAAAIL